MRRKGREGEETGMKKRKRWKRRRVVCGGKGGKGGKGRKGR